MDDFFSRSWQEIVARPGGPLALRFYLQPIVATLLAVRDGVKDARTDRPIYLWALVTAPGQRRELLRSGWSSIAKVFVIAFVLDSVYQFMVLKGVRPLQGLAIAALLALVPYVAIRGPINRIVRGARGGSAPKGKPA